MQKMLFIMNPCAGLRKANKYLPQMISIFNQGGYEVTTYMTAGPGDGTQVVKRRLEDFDLVVCAGGDGTLNETISGVLQTGIDRPIGYIPCGSTNDFATSLKLSGNILQAAQDIVDGTPVAYDVGQFNHRYFSYVASFGAFTRASYSTPQSVKNALGHLAYILEGIQELPQIRTTHMRLELEDEVIEGDFIFGAVSNSTSVGGILTLSPEQVDMCDGKFEILLVRVPKDPLELHECIVALRNQKYNCNMITFRSAPSLTIFPEPDMPWTLDGEKADGQSVIQIKNLRQAVRLIQNGNDHAVKQIQDGGASC